MQQPIRNRKCHCLCPAAVSENDNELATERMTYDDRTWAVIMAYNTNMEQEAQMFLTRHRNLRNNRRTKSGLNVNGILSLLQPDKVLPSICDRLQKACI